MRILIVGDTHGTADFLRFYIYPVALAVQADAIVQLGDFGAWEHDSDGVAFMDEVGRLSSETTIPLYWLHGNHDKHSHTLATYKPDFRGFYTCRPFVFYIPQGHSWIWRDVSMRAFGGAYSVDRAWRVEREAERGEKETLWFPEEEMTDSEMSELLRADSGRKQIIFSHDKPFSAKPSWNRKDLPGCLPNQLRLERALRAHRPDWWFHGHLHYHYTDHITGDGFTTTVIGLDPDWNAAGLGWKKVNSWSVADLADGQVTVTAGRDMFVDQESLQSFCDSLSRSR